MSQNNRKNTNEKDHTGEVMSWVIIFLLMFAFPPVGLILLILKMRNYAKPNAEELRNKVANAKTKATETSQKAAEHAKAAAQHVTGQSSDSVSQVIDQAAAAAQAAINQASIAAQGAINHVKDATRQQSSEYSASSKKNTSQYTTARPAPQTTGRARPHGMPKEDAKSKKGKEKSSHQLDKKSGRAISVVLLIISVALFILGANTIVNAATGIWGAGDLARWPELWLGAFYFSGGFISLFSRNIVSKRVGRYRTYYAYIYGRNIIPMSDIAQTAGVSVKTVRRDIQKMLNEGYFDSGAYIDHELGCLVLCGETAEEYRKSSPLDDIVGNSEQIPLNQYMAIIMELRELNLSISDITISRKIDRIEELTAKIFRIVEEHPEKKNQIRRFETYYLPTTMKLVRSYSTLEKQGVKGENIMTAKENIGRVLDTLAVGYEQQLDQLFRSDAMDIAADITVLENLMQQDGLSGEKSEFRTMTG